MSNQKVYIPNTALNSFAHTLTAARVPDVGTREPFLMIDLDINKSKPQYSQVSVKVTHFIRGEEKVKAFEVKTKLSYVMAALARLRRYAEKPYDGKREVSTWEIKAPKFVDGKPTSERVTSGKLVVGRTEKGPFISVVHWNDRYPHIAFYPGLVDGNNIGSGAGDDAEKNYDFVCDNAIGWVDTISELLPSEWTRCINAAWDNVRNNQGGGGGNSYNGGGSNNYGNDATESYSDNTEAFNF